MRSIAIAGGGASGLLLTAALLHERDDVRVTIYEPDGLGHGLAYSTTCPAHLLNVPAGNMSAFASEPTHFSDWLEKRYPGTYSPASFVARSIYGDYLSYLASDVLSRYPERLTVVAQRVEEAVPENDRNRVRVTSSDGIDATFDAFVLATGHAPSARATFAIASPRYFASAWTQRALTPDDPFEPVVIAGSGLTAIDAILGLRDAGHRGKITLVSTRGLLPHEHRRVEAGTDNWRQKVDALRPVTNKKWQAMDTKEQRRFLHHFAAYWNVHRHRMAPQIARTIAELIAQGTVRVVAGRIRSIDEASDAFTVSVRLRASDETISVAAARIINCTGPDQDISRSQNPLIRSLVDRGFLSPHPVGLGARIADDGALIDRTGAASHLLFGIGPVRFGSLFETTAIPDIRVQAQELARTLLRRDLDSDASRRSVVAADGVREIVG